MARSIDRTPAPLILRDALVLTVPGFEKPDAAHWQSRWAAERADCASVDLGLWDAPRRNAWVTTLGHAIAQADRPVILVAQGLACLAVAWWAALERPAYGDPVAGALLVAPPDVDSAVSSLRHVGFGPAPKNLMPFPSVVVASRNDSHMDFHRAQGLARFWGSHCIDGGTIGSADGDADLGAWGHGQHALNWLIALTADAGSATRVEADLASNIVRLIDRGPTGYAGDMTL